MATGVVASVHPLGGFGIERQLGIRRQGVGDLVDALGRAGLDACGLRDRAHRPGEGHSVVRQDEFGAVHRDRNGDRREPVGADGQPDGPRRSVLRAGDQAFGHTAQLAARADVGLVEAHTD